MLVPFLTMIWVFTVGEIYVNPIDDEDNAGSGLIGALSRIDFLTTEVGEELVADDFRVFPNPSSSTIRFSIVR